MALTWMWTLGRPGVYFITCHDENGFLPVPVVPYDDVLAYKFKNRLLWSSMAADQLSCKRAVLVQPPRSLLALQALIEVPNGRSLHHIHMRHGPFEIRDMPNRSSPNDSRLIKNNVQGETNLQNRIRTSSLFKP